MYYISFLNKWLHLFSIVGVLGSILFALLVLLPTVRAGTSDEAAAEPIWKRFGMILGIFWLVALATGFLNLWLVTPQVNSRYQMYVGMKMGLALVMFFLSLPVAKRLFPNRSIWLSLLTVLGIVILGLSANLNLSRINGRGLKQPTAVTAPAAQTPGR